MSRLLLQGIQKKSKHFLFHCQQNLNRYLSAEELVACDWKDCSKLLVFVSSCGQFLSQGNEITAAGKTTSSLSNH